MSQHPTVIFLGTMNAMPMAYALKFREYGWDVSYFVDVPQSDTLSRPEYKFPAIGYPYPDWIIERPVRSQLLAALSPGFFLKDIIASLRKADVVVLSGLYLCFARFLRPEQKIFFLSYGSDLDTWCDKDSSNRLAHIFADRVGLPLAKLIVRTAVNRMINSLKKVSAVIAFPPGIIPSADKVLNRELKNTNIVRISRYDISFHDLPEIDRIKPPAQASPLKVICGTRHTYRKHPGLSEEENKGTDIIIKGLSRYIKTTGNALEIHFFDKGLDVLEAKELCRKNGIDTHITWHKPMPFRDFLKLHQECHIAFDQTGSHLFGLGMYAMYLGMPVIANCSNESLHEFWGSKPPVCQAKTEQEVFEWLVLLENEKNRQEIGKKSHVYARDHFDCTRTVEKMLSFLKVASPK